MRLFNTLTKKIESFMPIKPELVRIYSCGPTVYDHIHIGNLRSFIAADTLRRSLRAAGYKTKHVMNITDIDDKMIARSHELYPDLTPEQALKKLAQKYETVFMHDMTAIHNEVEAYEFVHATDQETIKSIQRLITKLYDAEIAYIADDGVYFSIEKYTQAGKKYGQLLDLTKQNTSNARIQNDEYDKDSIHDFALWKTRKDEEPAWEFSLDGHELLGRPGWHIECSTMSTDALNMPFDIHTGGIDLIFPHHENEIAQSTAATSESIYATCFVHNEHLLVEGKKMSKSLNNFFTLRDIEEKGFEPLSFRMLCLQAHYRSQLNFSWETLQAAQNRLQNLRNVATLRWQAQEMSKDPIDLSASLSEIQASMLDDIDTPNALAKLGALCNEFDNRLVATSELESFTHFITEIDALLGLDLMQQKDITKDQKSLIAQREAARQSKDWERSDTLRTQLLSEGIGIRDTETGTVWYRT